MQSEAAPSHYILYHLCAKWWFLTLFVHNHKGNKSQKYDIFSNFINLDQNQNHHCNGCFFRAMPQKKKKTKESSHSLILSNAYNKNTDFNLINSEENLFRLTNPKLSTECKCSEQKCSPPKYIKNYGHYMSCPFQHVAKSLQST